MCQLFRSLSNHFEYHTESETSILVGARPRPQPLKYSASSQPIYLWGWDMFLLYYCKPVWLWHYEGSQLCLVLTHERKKDGKKERNEDLRLFLI